MSNNVSKVSTSWISGLIISSILSFSIFCLSLILLSVDIHYLLNKHLNFLTLDSIVFPIELILSILTILFSIYLTYNAISWFMISIKSLEKRKTFNLVISIFALTTTTILIADAIYRSYYLLSNIAQFLYATEETLKKAVFILQLWNLNILQPTPFLVLITSLMSSIFYLLFFLFQRKLFKSEFFENSQEKLQNHYTNNLIKEKKKKIAKLKPRDLSKRIKAF